MHKESANLRIERQGRLGVITLDRPKALNALTHDMVRGLSRQLALWRDDAEVAAVLVKAVPGRAFCAGGDIRQVTDRAREAGVEAAVPFFRDEYRLDWRINRFPKPYIAFLDGIVMGGGVGISRHGSHRVVTENTVFAMPETGIGFFPDVGGSWFLPSCPGGIGAFLGLTGHRLRGAGCLYAGIATHFVPAGRLGELQELLAVRLDAGAAPPVVEECLQQVMEEPEPGSLSVLQDRIARCFATTDIGEIVRQLQAEETGFGAEQLAILRERSPFAVHVALALQRRGQGLPVEDCLRLEYRAACRFLAEPDFHEGVRAMVVDKDRRPRWRHASLADVDPAEVEACLAPLPDGELPLDWEES